MLAEKQPNPFRDEQTRKRIHEHLRNKNDKISDEDISNVKTDIEDGVPATPAKNDDANQQPGPAGVGRGKEGETPVETPWKLLDE